MDTDGPSVLVLACPWNGRWQVFVLSPVDGLVGSCDARTPAEVERRAREVLAHRLGGPASGAPLEIRRR